MPEVRVFRRRRVFGGPSAIVPCRLRPAMETTDGIRLPPLRHRPPGDSPAAPRRHQSVDRRRFNVARRTPAVVARVWTAPAAAALLLAATAAGQTIEVDPPVTVTWTGSQAPTADTYRVAESGPDGDHIHTVSPIELTGRPAGLYTFTLQRCSTRPRSRSDEDGDDPPDPGPSTRSPVCLPAALDFAHVNTRPAVSAIADIEVAKGSTGTRTVTVTDADAGDAHTVSASSGDASVATVAVSGKRLAVRGVACGTATVTVTATDDSGAANATSTPVTFAATVPNVRPVVGPVAPIEVGNGRMTFLDVAVTDDACGGAGHALTAVSDADPDDAHTLTARSDANATALAYPVGGRVKVRAQHRGTATVSVTATDDSGADNDTSDPPVRFRVTVPNSRPVVGAMSDVAVSNGRTHAARVPVRDADARDAHTLSAATSDASVAAAEPSGRDVLVRGVGRGEATVTVRATDDSGADNDASEPRTFRATVPNSRPAVEPVVAVAVAVGGEAAVVPRVTDADAGDTRGWRRRPRGSPPGGGRSGS
ncbi:MAG: hypothetical protein F4X98_11830 [Gammaproteobacteria bacterium]|nr:hypothetical protein [Gammaproteobacteria bacterium]